MSGVNNNGLHSANGIAALFIATGQDAANVAESSAALNFSELLPNGDYYASITLPSLIVATYGGGTGLATQRECLELLTASAATGPDAGMALAALNAIADDQLGPGLDRWPSAWPCGRIAAMLT